MFSIVACPRCAGQVSISSAANPTAHVCCPLCDSQYPLSEVLAALPPALIVVDGPAGEHGGTFPPMPHWPAAEEPLADAPESAEWQQENEFDLTPLPTGNGQAGEPHAHGEVDSLEDPLSSEDADSLGDPHSLDEPLSFDDPHTPADPNSAEPIDDFGASDPRYDATVALNAADFGDGEHASFSADPFHEADQLQDLDEPQDLGFAGAAQPHPMHGSEEPGLDAAAGSDSPFAEHDAEEPHDLGFPEAAQPHHAHATEMPGFEEETGSDSPFAEHGEAGLSDAEFAPADEFSMPGEDAFGAAGDGGFAESEPHAFGAPDEESEFGPIDQEGFGAEPDLQPGEFRREVAEDAGEEIGLAEFGAEGGDEFSLPVPGKPPAAEKPGKDKKGAKSAKAKPAKVKAAKSDKPSRSLVGALMLMLSVVLGGILVVAGIYMGILWGMGPSRDFLALAPMMPSWALPASFQKGGRSPMLAGGPGMPSANPLGQTQPGFSPPVPGEEPATSADNNAPPAPDGLEAPAPGGKKPAADDAEMPAEKPGAANDDDFPGVPKAKPKADDGLGGEPEEKMPAEKKPSVKDELAADEKPADEPLADKVAGTKPAAKMPAEKPADEETLPGEAPAGKPAAKPEAGGKDELGLGEMPAKKPKAPAEDNPLAEPPVPAAAPVVPADAPVYALTDLDQAMTDVLDSTETMAQADTLSPDELKKARAQYYRRFYKLGEVVTFAEDDDAAPRLAEERVAITALLKKTGSDEEKLGQIGRAAVKWLAYSKRGEHAGILLAGTVAEIGQQGKLHEVKIAVPGVEEPISVFSSAKPKVAEEDQVMLLGSVVDDPTANLPGYDGTQPAVVWNGLTVKLPVAADAAAPEETK